MNKYSLLLVVGFFFLVLANPIQSQNATITLSKDSILIGERVELKIEVICYENASIIIPWQAIYDSISNNFEILSQSKPDTLFLGAKNKKQITETLFITSWEEGMQVIYPFEFECNINGEVEKFESEALLISVYLIDVDDTLPPKDIKSIISVPITFREMLPWIIGALLILIIAWLLYKYRNKFKKKKPVEITQKLPDIPSHVYALEKLEELKKKKLWQDGKVKQFHVELSTIVRAYIELRYRVIALEMTTYETLEAVKTNLQNMQNQYNNLERIITLADLVKFAKHQPLPDENQKNLDLAFDFVYNTMEKEFKEEEKNQ